MTDEERLANAISLMSEERWEEAVSLLDSVAATNSTFSVLWNLGWAHFKLGEYRVAQDRLGQAVDLEPDNPIGHYGLGSVLLAGGLHAEAERELSRALELRDSTLCRLSLALALMLQGLFEEAETVHTRGIQIKPDSVERLEAYADFLDDAGREEEAEGVRTRASELRHIN